MTSDEMFNILPSNKKYDIIFIDGLHEYKQVARDIVNSFKHLNINGKIIIHDTLPTSYESSLDEFPTKHIAWYGSVYKTIMQLSKIAPIFYTVERMDDEEGLTIVDYFVDCDKIAFEPQDTTYAEYEKNKIKQMRIIDEETFKKLFFDDLKLFEIGHKEWSLHNQMAIPLQVSSAFNDDNICSLKDNLGIEISSLNKLYCELTGIYWIWKNALNNGKYIGQYTYRRPFMIENDFSFERVFRNYDIIVPNKMYFDETVYEQYGLYHNIKDIDTIFDIIMVEYPDYIKDIELFKKQKYLYNSNGFIMKAEDYSKYCDFLFNVLFKWQEKMNIYTISDMDDYVNKQHTLGLYHFFGEDEKEACINYQRRAIGFLSERIFNIYLNHNFNKIFHIPYFLTETEY